MRVCRGLICVSDPRAKLPAVQFAAHTRDTASADGLDPEGPGVRSGVAGQLLASWVGLLLLGWAVGELVKVNLTAWDSQAVGGFAAERAAGPTAVAHALSFLASGYWVVPVTVIACLLLYKSSRRTDAVAVGLTVIGASAMSTVDKLLVGRPRPPGEHLEAVGSASFPSGHATSAGALYLALLMVLLRARPRPEAALAVSSATALLVLGVALSRVYLGVHYPSDVIAGLLLGCGWSLVVNTTVASTSTPASRGI